MIQIPAFRKQHLQQFPDSAVFRKRPVTSEPVKELLYFPADSGICIFPFFIRPQKMIQAALLFFRPEHRDLFFGKEF